jgi:branched-chain amino acid transport system substrate-binding protein
MLRGFMRPGNENKAREEHVLSRTLCTAAAFAALAIAAPARAEDVRIGAVFPMSGPNAIYGDIFGAGASLAADHANADHLLSGKLTIQFEDSQALPQQGVIVMNKLVNVEKVPYVFSAFTGVSKAISPIAQRTKTVTVNGGAVGPDLAELGPYFWNVIPLANFEVRTFVPYVVKERGLKRWVLVYVDDPVGQAIKKELETNLPVAGGELAETLSVPVNAQQFSGIAARVRDVKPDGVYIVSYGAQQLQIIKQLRDNGVSQQLASYSAFGTPDINTVPEAMGALYTSQTVNWASNDPVTKRFVDSFKAKYGKDPTVYNANYYNASRLFALLASALQKKGKPITGESLLAERLETKTFEFVGGTVSFEPNGTVVAPIQISEVDGKGGKFVK